MYRHDGDGDDVIMFRPCSLDAVVYGYLSSVLKLPYPNSFLREIVEQYPPLLRYIETMDEFLKDKGRNKMYNN